MFYGLSGGRVNLEGITIRHQLEDIQTLNERATNREPELTAISAHAYAFAADKYWIMRTGASVGERYGPVIVSKRYQSLDDLRGKAVATPGKLTTATLLFKLFTEGIHHVDVPFDQIMDRVIKGEFDAGLLIHEGQLTYGCEGFTKILDFGELWDSMYKLPLPLGLDVVRKDLGEETARSLSLGLRRSIHYGYTHQKEALPYVLQFGRGIDLQVVEKFVKLNINELTMDMGDRGRSALELLFRLGVEHDAIPLLRDFQLM
jgi:1,4-dihydroxy-6-naphthoate synthase